MYTAAVETQQKTLRLELLVRDSEVIRDLCQFTEGAEQSEFALSALRIGVLALRQANGIVDAHAIRNEGDLLVGSIRELLTHNTKAFVDSISTTLKSYFDPAEGHLPQRLDRLLKKDGELQSLLGTHLGAEDSVISRTLVKHIGKDSPLLRLLSPEEKQGVIALLGQAIEGTLQANREQVLKQFSLDDKESALSRLVLEMTGVNGQLRQDLEKDVKELHKEFSLDNEQGALARLVRRVENAQSTISREFSLDNKESALCRLVRLMETANSSINANLTFDDENSPLSRLRRELTDIVKRLEASSSVFQEEVKITLESFKARREESARSTRHGLEFQHVVGAVVQAEAHKCNDLFEDTGNTTGAIPYSKKGDHVVTLGSESACPGARIVIEAKEDRTYNATQAIEEIDQAAKNREAQVGLFVFSRKAAPASMPSFTRHGKHLLVVWDQDDPATDIYLQAGISVARALVIRERLAEVKNKDLISLRNCVTAIGKEMKSLEEISKWAQTVKNSGTKIGKRAESLKKKLATRLLVLERYCSGDDRSNDELTRSA